MIVLGVMALMIEDLKEKIACLEDLIREISSEIIANVAYETAQPADLWAKSETSINSIKDTAKNMRDAMLILKPERASSIKRRFRAFIQPIENFVETLKELPERDQSASKQALNHLRNAIKESQYFIELAKEIAQNPSESILEVLRLREVYRAKEYISRVSVPETVYARLEHLKVSMNTLKLRVSSLEEAIKELLRQMDRVQEEILKFHREEE